jgi:hypothetical protein
VRIGDDFKSKSWLDKSSISLLLKQRQLLVAEPCVSAPGNPD